MGSSGGLERRALVSGGRQPPSGGWGAAAALRDEGLSVVAAFRWMGSDGQTQGTRGAARWSVRQESRAGDTTQGGSGWREAVAEMNVGGSGGEEHRRRGCVPEEKRIWEGSVRSRFGGTGSAPNTSVWHWHPSR
uniref:Uncharacterized protein n=1 Tax=Aegilops tauschii subsp. strangulata TaxID=200361 RepID=A0A453M654_AEGTS